MNDTHTLLRKYAQQGDDTAFRELVHRHVDLVFSAALRVLHGNASEAEEVVQAAFTELARKAGSLAEGVILSGWLYQTATHLAQRRVRAEVRRRHREQEAMAMHDLEKSPEDSAPWTELMPVLDEAMGKLQPRERDALVLRYFEKQDHRTVGAALGLSDDAAQKCVSRALDKLRGHLDARGIRSTATALSMVLLTNALQAAPEALAGRLAGRALASAAAGLGMVARWKFRLAVGLAVAGAAVPVVWQQQRMQHLQQSVAATADVAVPVAQSPEIKAPQAPKLQAAPANKPGASTEDLVQQAAKQLQGGAQHFTATIAAMNLLAQIPLAEIPSALRQVLAVKDVGAQTLLFKLLLGRWTETNPEDSMAFARDYLPAACRVGGMEGLLSAWGGSNNTAGLAMMSKTITPLVSMGSNSLTTSLYQSMASRNLPEAVRQIGKITSTSERGYALRGIMEHLRTEADRLAMLPLLETLPDEVRLQAKRSFIERWADLDSRAAATWVLEVPDTYERSRLMDSLGLVWLQREPQAAADWWIAQAPGNETLTKIVNVWAHDDPNAAGKWLREHAVGPTGDDARMTFARQVQELDTESAFAWAETISQPVLREATFDHIFRSWHLRDTASAQQFLQKNLSLWPAERTARLQSLTNSK